MLDQTWPGMFACKPVTLRDPACRAMKPSNKLISMGHTKIQDTRDNGKEAQTNRNHSVEATRASRHEISRFRSIGNLSKEAQRVRHSNAKQYQPKNTGKTIWGPKLEARETEQGSSGQASTGMARLRRQPEERGTRSGALCRDACL